MPEESNSLQENNNNTFYDSPSESENNKGPGIFAMLKPDKNYLVTPVIVFLNVAVYVIMVLSGVSFIAPSTGDMLLWGANLRMETLDGEWWRLLTCCFLHYGIIHLAFNMYALVSLGYFLEPLIGKRNFLFSYLLAGLGSSIASTWWNENAVSAGASGAIFGMYGVFAALLTTNYFKGEGRKALLSKVVGFIVYNLILGFGIGIVDNAGHIGGLISGLLLGYSIYFIFKAKQPAHASLIIAGMTALMLSLATYMYFTLPNNTGRYFSNMDKVHELEVKALNIYKLPETTDRLVFMDSLKKSILYIDSATVIVSQTKTLNLPEQMIGRTVLIKSYLDLRKDFFTTYLKAVSVDSMDFYSEKMKELNQKIEKKINEIDNYK